MDINARIMARNVKKKKVIKTQEQIDILNELYDDGMTSVKDKEKVAEAVSRTGLPETSVKDWINNKRKPNRGASKRRSSNLNIYTAFMAAPTTEIDSTGKNLGDLAKVRAERYQSLKSTAEGRRILQENLERMKEPQNIQQLTDAQKHGRAIGIYSKIKQEADKLENLGYSAVMLVAQPDGQTALLGASSGVYFFRNRPKVISEFVQCMNEGEVIRETKDVVRHRVQTLFNKLYAEATGQDSAVMPYTAIKAGLEVSIDGLPEGVVFKKPSSYSLSEMKRILDVQSSLQVSLGTNETDLLLSKDEDSEDTPSESKVTTEDQEMTDDFHESETVFMPAAEDMDQSESNPSTVDDVSLTEEEMPELAKPIPIQTKDRRSKRIKRSKDNLDGKKIRHLWDMNNKKKGHVNQLWLNGVVTGHFGSNYLVRYEDDEALYLLSFADAKRFIKEKTLIVV